ncbi:hypothetical protein ILUMI_08366 [Ignelater luminosus]|uniref:Glycosyltransferase 2-like domain-containing protein n=1 Tax=Ignelater luminosus TaxID=2038154 RepID=A0A8K0GAQ3_IGNLU|nr:hypothetical protein ILUMI_08366 [Ignelater luminosus]
MKYVISIIIPIHNGDKWINNCFNAILHQSAIGLLDLEICVCNDASTDKTLELLDEWKHVFNQKGVPLHVFNNISGVPQGVGYAKNKAVSISNGDYLCFQDIDDVMLENRILFQYNQAIKEPFNTIVGCKFKREPENSTVRYTKWANSLLQEQLNVQIYTSHGPTVIMPTWFCNRTVFDSIGGFSEKGKGEPEDLLFFYKHLDLGGKICRVDECLLIYNYHVNATTFSIHEDTIWNIRIERVERDILSKWSQFTIWNAGKQGRKFFNSLKKENRSKVIAMCDINANLIGRDYMPYSVKTRKVECSIPIVHFKDAKPPFIICVKMDMTDGAFESNLQSLDLQEDRDYILFS